MAPLEVEIPLERSRGRTASQYATEVGVENIERLRLLARNSLDLQDLGARVHAIPVPSHVAHTGNPGFLGSGTAPVNSESRRGSSFCFVQ